MLLKFLEKENVFFKRQFDFRPKHSTDYAILSIIDKVQKAFDEGELSCGLFLDFSKAFDTVDHVMGRVVRKGPGRHILSIFSFKLFCPLHSPNNMMEVTKVRK